VPLSALLAHSPLRPLLERIGAAAAREGLAAYAVGGVVRDLLLGRTITDIDVVAIGAGSGVQLAEAVRKDLGAKKVYVYEAFGTAAVRLPEGRFGYVEDVEFVAARRESYRGESRKPDVEAGTLDDDLARRDFTVNALAIDLSPDRFGTLEDRFDGLHDLAAGLLRTPLDPAQTFSDDPLRMVRAARFAAQLRFRVDESALAAMREMAHRIEIVSMERIETELHKLMAAPAPSVGLRVLDASGLLPHLLPELDALKGVAAVDGVGHKDNFAHTLQVIDNTADRSYDLWLRWAALCHDLGKARTKRFVPGKGWTFYGHEEVGARMVPKLFRRLKFPLDDRMDYVEKLVRLHHRPHALVDDGVTDSAVRRLLFDAGEDVDDLMTLCRADLTSKNPKRVARYLRGFDRVDEKLVDVEARDHVRTFQPPVSGEEIMDALGVSEGLAVGILKEQLKEAVLDGVVPNEHDAAFAFVLSRADDARRRGALFDRLRTSLPKSDRRALGALRETLASDPNLPEDEADALAYLDAVRDRALATDP